MNPSRRSPRDLMTVQEPVYPSTKDNEIAHIPAVKAIPGARVLIFGKTRSGKSAFGNRFFNEQLRRSKVGSACPDPAQDVRSSDPAITVCLRDTPGFELLQFKEQLRDLEADIRESCRSVDSTRHYASALILCRRGFSGDEAMLARRVSNWKLPVGIVFTDYENANAEIYDLDINCANADENDAMVNEMRSELKKAGVDPNTVKMFVVNTVPTAYPVAGF
jgi:GTPase Era involved in 16S rRNA processing